MVRTMALIAALIATPAIAQVGSRLDQTKLLAPDWSINSPAGLDRAYYFGGDNHTLVGTGESERYIDPLYCEAADPVQANTKGGFSITARVATPKERQACHLKANEAFVSGLVTSQHSFSATYGYWEIYTAFPTAMRSWPAFWLLPTAKTAANGGSAPEIDVLEAMAGVKHGVTGSNHWTNDRTGYPISTLHPLGGGGPMSCGKTVSVKGGSWHTYGVLWEPTKLTFYVDEVATCEVDAVVSDPHYMLINLAMTGGEYTPGPTSPAIYPATMSVGWVVHRPLRD